MNKTEAREKIALINEEAARLRRVEQEEYAARYERERACFWEWPFGHVWLVDHEAEALVCQACGKIGRSVKEYDDYGY